MAIKVLFPTGESNITVKGLYQWDYGQTLEIECAEIGSEILEVHFACHSMTEAIVRVCTFSNGVGTVTIPDECLEQTSAITAWIYEVDGSQGHTIKTITLPITARTRPSKNRDIAEKYVDEYAQLMEEVNEAVDNLENGNVTAAHALNADNAKHATTAGSAQSATHATTADSAQRATHATTAERANVIEYIPSMVCRIDEFSASSKGYNSLGSNLKNGDLYMAVFDEGEGVGISSGIFRYDYSVASRFAVGGYVFTINDIGEVTLPEAKTGTLKFYVLGGSSE